jgi:hypothetical protein
MNENEFYRRASLRVCGHLDIAEALRSTLEYFQGIIPADRLYLQLYEADLGSMRTVAMANKSEAKQLDALSPLPLEARSNGTLNHESLASRLMVYRPSSDC